MGIVQSVGFKSGLVLEFGVEFYRVIFVELRLYVLLGVRKLYIVVVQMGEGIVGIVIILFLEELVGVLDFIGMRFESQLVCCDMVYKFFFGSSCIGIFYFVFSVFEKSVVDVVLFG